MLPQNPIPEAAAQMISVLGIPPLRAEILRYLATHEEGSTSGDIAAAIGTRNQTVQRHLEQLEELGAVTASVAAPRRGHHVVFTLSETALVKAIREASNYISGK